METIKFLHVAGVCDSQHVDSHTLQVDWDDQHVDFYIVSS